MPLVVGGWLSEKKFKFFFVPNVFFLFYPYFGGWVGWSDPNIDISIFFLLLNPSLSTDQCVFWLLVVKKIVWNNFWPILFTIAQRILTVFYEYVLHNLAFPLD